MEEEMKKVLVVLLAASFLLLSCEKTVEQKRSEIMRLFITGEKEKANMLALKYYQKNPTELAGWFYFVNESEEREYLKNVEIQKGWKFLVDGDYSYIRGKVKNAGAKTISYFKITAELLDSKNNVVDTDFTNCSESVSPGAMKSFEMMFKSSDEYESARLGIDEITLD
jgi:hypothetical protein